MSITNYKKTITELTQDLAKLETYAEKLGMENSRVTLRELNEHIKHDRFNLAVLGEFRRGKSTLINALLRTPLLPSDIVPTTASVNRITYDSQPQAKVEYFDGTSEEIAIENLAEYATQDGEKSDNVREVTVWYPTVYCSNNVDIYDTPGLNDSERMTQATTEVISRMDVAIFVLAANVNFSMSECEFIGEKLMTSDVGRVIFVVTRMDEYTPEQKTKILSSIRKRIETMILSKAEEVLDDDDEKLAAFKKKLGDIQIYGVSSTMALKARETHDLDLLEKSGFPAFERAIDELLTQQRGRVMLEKQSSSILKACQDIFNQIKGKLAPLTMDEDDYNRTCLLVEKEINAIKAKLNDECFRLDNVCTDITKELREKQPQEIEEMKTQIRLAAAELNVEKANMKRKNQDAFVEEVWKTQMAPLIQHQLQVYSEKLTDQISQATVAEYENLDAYATQVAEHMENIALAFNFEGKKNKLDETELAKHALMYAAFGTYGQSIMYGYRTAKWKGAILGGASSLGLSVGSSMLAGFALGLAGVTATPVALAAVALSAVAGMLGGNAIVKKVFWKDRADVFRNEIAQAACDGLDQVLADNEFTHYIEDYVSTTFAGIKNELRKSTEGTLSDLQYTLSRTRENYAAEKAQAEQQLQDYTMIMENLSAITERTQRVREDYHLDVIEEA